LIKKIALALTLTLAPLSSFAADFIEGKHYTEISEKAPSVQPKLTEFFSFYCHSCYDFEKEYIGDIKANLNPNVTFDTKHVDFMNSDIGTELIRSLAVMQELNTGSRVTEAMFAAIQGEEDSADSDHTSHAESKINSRDDIKQLFRDNYIDISKYDEIADSKVVDDKIALWRAQQSQFQIQSVPTFIINDKYAINMGEIRSLGQLIDLINYLAIDHK